MINWRRVPLRTLVVWFIASFAVFVACCYLIYAWHREISNSVVATYAVVGLAGLSALVWPIFAVKLIGALVRRALRRGLSNT